MTNQDKLDFIVHHFCVDDNGPYRHVFALGSEVFRRVNDTRVGRREHDRIGLWHFSSTMIAVQNQGQVELPWFSLDELEKPS